MKFLSFPAPFLALLTIGIGTAIGLVGGGAGRVSAEPPRPLPTPRPTPVEPQPELNPTPNPVTPNKKDKKSPGSQFDKKPDSQKPNLPKERSEGGKLKLERVVRISTPTPSPASDKAPVSDKERQRAKEAADHLRLEAEKLRKEAFEADKEENFAKALAALKEIGESSKLPGDDEAIRFYADKVAEAQAGEQTPP